MLDNAARRQRACAVIALVTACGSMVLRLTWALGGRWGYTACSTREVSRAEAASGCGADAVADLPLVHGWVAVALSAVAALVAVAALKRARWAGPAALAACAVVLAVSFPLHLLFEVPAGLAGWPTDWRGVVHRLVLVAGALAFAGAVPRARCPHPADRPVRPLPPWARRAAYAGLVLPLVGWTLPHLLWMLGVPAGITRHTLDEALRLGLPIQLLITFAPAAGAVLTVGLTRPWAQRVPRRVPGLGGRRMPRMLAIGPAMTVAFALAGYGLWGLALMTRDVATGAVTVRSLITSWAVVGTEIVFVGWAAAVAVATAGYARATRCGPCRSARVPAVDVRAGARA